MWNATRPFLSVQYLV